MFLVPCYNVPTTALTQADSGDVTSAAKADSPPVMIQVTNNIEAVI